MFLGTSAFSSASLTIYMYLSIEVCRYYYCDFLKTLNGPNLKALQVSVPLRVSLNVCCAKAFCTLQPRKKPLQSPLLPPSKTQVEK